MGIEKETQSDPNLNVYEVEILGRQITIETTSHPDRDPEQTSYRISGDFEGTYLEGGLVGITTETDKEKMLKRLKKDVEYIMTDPPEA